MKSWDNIIKAAALVLGTLIIAFNVLLYNFCEKQKMEADSIRKEQQIESKVSDNKFKYEEQQVYFLSKDLRDTQQQVKDQKDTLTAQSDALAAQKDALLQEVQKRQQIENDSKAIQTSLVDIEAEADAIKENMKGWQKDYVSVLAEIEKKMDDSQVEIKGVKDNLDSLNIPGLKESIESLKADIEKINHPPDNALPNTPVAPDKTAGNTQSESQSQQ